MSADTPEDPLTVGAFNAESDISQEAAETIDHVSMSRFASASRHQFFEGAERGQILDILPLLSFEEKNCILIEAEQGFGKTSLAHQIYVQTLENGHQACMVHGSELATSDDSVLLQTIAQHLKLKVDAVQVVGNGQALAQAFLQSSQKQLVLVIDDAQAVSSMALTLLLQFLGECPRNRVQLVLLALAKAPVLLADSNLQGYLSEYGYQVKLRALNSRETGEYVRFLLIASERDEVKLSRQALSRIFQMSAGVPAKVNEALVYALQDYDQQPQSDEVQRSEIVPKWHLVSLSLVAVGVLGLILFGNPEQKGERFSDTISPMPESPPPSYKAPPIRFTDAQAPKRLQPDETAEQAPSPVLGEVAQASTRAQEQRSLNPQQDESQVAGENPQPVEREPKPELELEPKVVEKPTPTKVSMDAKIAKLRAQREETKPAKATSGSRNASPEQQAVWVKGMAPDHYTLQLLGGANEGAIKEFVQANGSYRKMGYFETSRGGQPWYVVLYGDFSSREQAVAAASKLPSKLRSSQPWPRSAGDIQSKMK